MSTWRNAEKVPKTWEESCVRAKAKAVDNAPEPQLSLQEIKVFPYGYTDPPKAVGATKSKTAKSKQAKSKPLPYSSLPDWAPIDFQNLHLYLDYLPMPATQAQMKNLFLQIHHHFASLGAHSFETSGLEGILPTTRWPVAPELKINDTHYIIRMRDDRLKHQRKEGNPIKAYLDFLIGHKNNYCAAWRVMKNKSEFETAKWCCFNDCSYLSEQEPFKGNIVVTNYNSGYSEELKEVQVWDGMYRDLFDFLYRLYEKPKSNTSSIGKRLFQTFFVAMCEGKRFPDIENFTSDNAKKQLAIEDAAVITTPFFHAVHSWSSISDLVFLLAIVLYEDAMSKRLIKLKHDPNDPKKPHLSQISVFEQFQKHRASAELRCKEFVSGAKGLHEMLLLLKDEVSDGEETKSYGHAAFERLKMCLNLVMFNRELFLALKARQSGFTRVLEVNLCSLKVEPKSTSSGSDDHTQGASTSRDNRRFQ